MNATRTTRVLIAALLSAAALSLCGCASISSRTQAYVGATVYPPRTPNSVQIFQTEPNLPKERLGEIVLLVEGSPSPQALNNRFRAEAAKLGADGVFIVSDQTHIIPVEYWDYWGPEGYTDWQRVIVGVAFKYK